MPKLDVLVADDHDIVRRGLRDLLEKQPGWKVVAEASNGREAVEKAKELKPDVSILDISMPSLDGLEAARQILESGSSTKVLILTMHHSDPLIQQMLKAGVRGYVLKSDAASELVQAVEALQRNKTFFTSKVPKVFLDERDKPAKKKSGQDHALRLTPRQREIVQLLAEGKNSREIAAALGTTFKTVETHRANIMRRLECHSVTELVRYAIRNDLIQA
ncbi:MAG: DNA-binding response regulator [Acidobacteria bacterium]|nr:MAG: DNA-binding response regulator [Acidobacteriota bacterium]